ncbi:MAG: hypothetical protein ACRDQD_19710 [Nocardioidaceae bacterium]
MAHLTEAYFERYEHTFGGHKKRRDDVVFADNAASAIRDLAQQVEAWRSAIAALDEEQAHTVGLSQATELDAAAPFGHLVLHMNRELIAHGAEIMALRDVYKARSGGSG